MQPSSERCPTNDDRQVAVDRVTETDNMPLTGASRRAAAGRRLSLLIVNSIRAYGGGENWALQTAEGLAGRGHRVALVGREGSELVTRAAERGLESFAQPMPSDLSLAAILRLAQRMRGWRADVVLCCNQRALRLGAPAARLAGVRRVVMRDGLQGSFLGSGYNRWIVRLVDGVVANAEATRRELLEWLPSSRVRVIYNGIDLRAYDASREDRGLRVEMGCPSGACVALSVARLAQEKDHATLLSAFHRAARTNERLWLWIAGDGPLRPVLAAQVERLGLGERVRLLGFRADVPRLLTAADLLVISSRREGLPNVALEAMAARRPLIATAVSGTPEVVRDGETGLLVPPAAPESLAAALSALAGDPVRRRQMGERGRRRVEQWFEASVALDRWEEYLCALLPQPSTRPAA
jgi:glycosyltransferase involved in cell wall biosynthesis